MKISKESYQKIYLAWLDGTADQADVGQLWDYLNEKATENELKDWMAAAWNELNVEKRLSAEAKRIIADRILNVHRQKAVVHRVHFLRTAWFRVAVIILIFSSIGAYLWQTNQSSPAPSAEASVKAIQNDVLPGSNKATLTLADGSVITLDSATGGTIARQSGASIQKSTDGKIIYAFNQATVSNSIAYNTMSTPRGGQYQLVLPDGSKIWLNAESSVTFPTAFTGNAREIKMTGEAYFEIKPNTAKPFIVKTISDEIQVLGTSFNVNAYSEAPVKTSLLEGKVKVKTAILKPGQAFINGKIVSTNITQDLAWKNGIFNFDNTDLRGALNQLSRWYDVKIVYEGELPDKTMRGEMGRDLRLKHVLRILKGMGIETRLEGNTLIILSASKK